MPASRRSNEYHTLCVDGLLLTPYNKKTEHTFDYIGERGFLGMTDNEKELINLIRDSSDPEKVASYMLSLFLDYLRTHAPSQEKPSVDLQESA